MMGKTEGKRRRGWQRICLDSIINLIDMNLNKLWERVRDGRAWCAAIRGVTESDMDLATEQQQQGSDLSHCYVQYYPEVRNDG